MSAATWTGSQAPTGVVIEPLEAGLAAIADLRASALSVGVRDSVHRDAAAPDLAVLDVGRAVPAAIVTTTNQVKAAPCIVGIEHVASGPIRAVVVNSGNANACTGVRGLVDARATAARLAELLGCAATEVVPMSTGVIGVPLPVDTILAGLPAVVDGLVAGPTGADALARAMMTTDTVPKQAAVRVRAGGTLAVVAGVAKGAGMIEPSMATMLSILVTDAELDAPLAGELLREVVERTFNRISVDGCGSTNDTVLLLATGSAGPQDRAALSAALEHVAADLSHRIVNDGEGVTRIANLRIVGAPDLPTARALGRAVASSALFRAALHGSDPNWGRVLAAMGASDAVFDPGRVTVRFGGVTVCRDGGAVPYDHAAAIEVLRGPEVMIEVDLGLGVAAASTLVADLSAAYVSINAEYTT